MVSMDWGRNSTYNTDSAAGDLSHSPHMQYPCTNSITTLSSSSSTTRHPHPPPHSAHNPTINDLGASRIPPWTPNIPHIRVPSTYSYFNMRLHICCSVTWDGQEWVNGVVSEHGKAAPYNECDSGGQPRGVAQRPVHGAMSNEGENDRLESHCRIQQTSKLIQAVNYIRESYTC